MRAINRNCVRYSSVSPILKPLYHVNSLLLIQSYTSTMLQIIYKQHKLYRCGRRDMESLVTNSERIRRSMPTTNRASRHDKALRRFGCATELPVRKKHASVYFTLNICCQNVFPAICIGKSRCENKTVGQE